MQEKKYKRQLYITLFVSVLFTANLIKGYMEAGELSTTSLIFTAVVYIATFLAFITFKDYKKKK